MHSPVGTSSLTVIVAVARATATITVRLLVPTGLCILPAFVLIGVIPCIAAFAGGMS